MEDHYQQHYDRRDELGIINVAIYKTKVFEALHKQHGGKTCKEHHHKKPNYDISHYEWLDSLAKYTNDQKTEYTFEDHLKRDPFATLKDYDFLFAKNETIKRNNQYKRETKLIYSTLDDIKKFRKEKEINLNDVSFQEFYDWIKDTKAIKKSDYSNNEPRGSTPVSKTKKIRKSAEELGLNFGPAENYN